MSFPPSNHVSPEAQLELIRWKQAQFARISEQVEDALLDLMSQIETTVVSMSAFAVSKAQVRPDALWKQLFTPWAKEVADQVETEMQKEVNALAAALSEKGASREALHLMLPVLANASLLIGSLAAIPSLVGAATVTSSFFFIAPQISVPILALAGTGLAVGTLVGSRGVDWLQDRNRARLVTRLQRRARMAVLGHGLSAGQRSFVADLQAATLRRLEAELETA
ncbi:hypothetical protein [Tropicibacter oceani]|uniref:MotA/TolQ/ExbB proton channel domain-containing protein n=1 Tax=Tropicibacter oceani TaxID=3058420 RepID=A0ABY8QEA3_9RHOB|nr:hypothetical protein [Tropicibacter oceani]WGW02773.1 hypothetical protein QF118_12595 [Tropicibacter oceani]